ncbi:hypothetical protein [Chryseobacterium luquanense]|uniref:Uncharacterized protein n=1 Tax=Chryseobacterium luquanense TaxID=2983766 RepID=A0ABT3XZD0_9FLAO|nr:hypothetical protein [Chryseobacterium luquanense]MCX8531225.1 hypothetical protein [Chryseobacterium luquanense]
MLSRLQKERLWFCIQVLAAVSGMNEDHVCASVHTTLVSYWAKQFAKS